MSGDAVAAIIVAFITVTGSILGVLIQRNTSATRQARDAARRAVTLSTPTGNGFAPGVEDSLESLHSKIDTFHEEFRRDIGGLRSETRAIRQDQSQDRSSVGDLSRRVGDLERERLHKRSTWPAPPDAALDPDDN